MQGYEGPHIQDNGDGTVSQRVSLTGSNVIQPSDIQSHYQQTIQTHNAVSVPLNSNSVGIWLDTDGFSDLALNFMNDANTANHVDIQWSNDGATIHSLETPLTNVARQYGAVNIPTKARYARVKVYNDDAALAHTMSAWAYLKA
jgi:hypothetical protein